MIVVDASAVVELVTDLGSTTALQQHLTNETLIAPDILPLEAASALRGLNLGGLLDDQGLATAAQDLARLPIALHPSLPLLPSVLALRNNVSAYDASYVVLAQVFRCPLLTLDGRLATAAMKFGGVEVVAV